MCYNLTYELPSQITRRRPPRRQAARRMHRRCGNVRRHLFRRLSLDKREAPAITGKGAPNIRRNKSARHGFGDSTGAGTGLIASACLAACSN